MRERLKKIMHREFGSLNEAALLLGIFSFLSQILGLVRDKLLAHFIGPGPTLDIYYAAFRIPDFLYVSIASFASVTVILPFLIQKINADEKDGTRTMQAFLDSVTTVYFVAMIIICGLLSICMPWLAHFVVPGFTSVETAKFVSITRILLISPIFLGFSNLFGSIAQLYKKFFVYSLSPLFYNIGILSGIVILYPLMGIYGLALGVVVGAILHHMIQVPVIMRHKAVPRMFRKVDWAEIKKVVKLSLPRTLGLSANSLALLVVISMASRLHEGSISIFNFSFNLQSVPLGIIGVSYSVAAFPTLARYFSEKSSKFSDYVIQATKQIIFWSLPISALFIVLRAQIVRVILGSGHFSWSDTKLTAAALALFSLSIVAQSLIMLFVRGYYAAGITTKPLLVNFLSSALIIVSAYIFLFFFHHHVGFQNFFETLLRVEGVPGTDLLMLPLAYSLGTIFNAWLHWVLFKKDFTLTKLQSFDKMLLQSFFAALVMGIVAYEILYLSSSFVSLTHFSGILVQGFVSGITGLCAGILLLYILKSEELFAVTKALKSKFWKKDVIAADQNEVMTN